MTTSLKPTWLLYDAIRKLMKTGWLEELVFRQSAAQNDFTEREAFIHLWRTGPFDLYYFNQRDRDKMTGRVNHLVDQLRAIEAMDDEIKEDIPDTEYVSTLENFAEAIHSSSNTVFEKYGVTLAYQWVMGRETEAEIKQEGINADNDVNEADPTSFGRRGCWQRHERRKKSGRRA